MELEKEIVQKSFKSPFHKAALNIIYTSSSLNLMMITNLRPYGISPQQFNILRILRGQHPKTATVKLIIGRMLDRASNASRLVEKLRQKELIERTNCSDDRRAVDVLITKKGLDLLAELDDAEKARVEKLGNLSEEEAVQLNSLLDKVRA